MSGFLFSYYRPWNEKSSLVNSWADYLKDEMRASMIGAQVGKRIDDACKEVGKYTLAASAIQVEAINHATSILRGKVDVLAEQQERTNMLLMQANEQLNFLNRRLDISIEQQQLSNMLLENIAELLKIPNSEKERQYAITYGIKFFINAAKDPDLYADALENFHKAEALHPQDYFVLHRLGCIYLYVPNYIDVKKALNYFSMAGKYASVEIDDDSIKSDNLLTNKTTVNYSKLKSDVSSIRALSAEAYNKAALASYILGDDEESVNYQCKAVKLCSSPENIFLYAKYLFRQGKDKETAIQQLSLSIDKEPSMANAVALDLDMMDNQEVLNVLANKSIMADNELDEIIAKSHEKYKVQLAFKAKHNSFVIRKGVASVFAK